METIVMRAEETSKLVEWLDLAYDELRRRVHHAATRATEGLSDGYDGDD